MDKITRQLAEYTSSLRFSDLPDDIVITATERIIDAFGCAFGGMDCEAARIGRTLSPVLDPTVPQSFARPIGDARRGTSVEAAGFTNSVMIRYLDFNDTIPGGHPSDALGPLISLADSIQASGSTLITALVAGYDLFVQFSLNAHLREQGWDQGFAIALATTAGASILLGLDEKRAGEAFSISIAANVPLRTTRAGELSLWKGAATAYAAKGGLFGTLLAAEGMTGPEASVEGRHGLIDRVTGPFELDPLGRGQFWTKKVGIKYWPAEFHIQAVVWAAKELREQVGIDDLQSIEVVTYSAASHEVGSEPAKWDPRTRETADHSLPYVFARVMQAGTLDQRAFEPEAYLDPAMRPLMDRISVRVNPAFDADFPREVRLEVLARAKSGETYRVEIRNPRGHAENPMTSDEVDEKYLGLVEPRLGDRATLSLKALRGLPDCSDVSGILDAHVVEATAPVSAG